MAALYSKHRKYTVLEVLEHIADGNISDVDFMWSDEEDEDGNADDARSPTIGEDRDEPLPVVGEEIEIEAEERQDLEDREDYEHEADVEPVLGVDPFTNITKKSDIQWPNYDTKKDATICKLEGCSGKTHIFCDKCKVHYCFVSQRNCFKDAHRK